jgi:hypothetical protein
MENNKAGNSDNNISHLHEQLIERAFNNWEEFRHSPQNSSPDNIFTDAVKVICRRDAYHFIKHYKEFTAEQLNCLLQFENPTELVGDYLDPSNDISVMPGVLDDILKNQDEYRGIYKTIYDLSTLNTEEKARLHGLPAGTGDRLSVRVALYRARQESQGCDSLQKKPIARSNSEHEH